MPSYGLYPKQPTVFAGTHGRDGNLGRALIRGIVAGDMTPRQDPLSGVIICPGFRGTAVEAELLGLPQQFYFIQRESQSRTANRAIAFTTAS